MALSWCKPCDDAGLLNSRMTGGEDIPESRIRKLHKACRGGNWCVCQHKIGKWLVEPQALAEEDGVRPA